MNEPFPRNDIKITVIGGGTGSFTLLNALKDYTHSIAAVVNMADDGGSTGVLRDELGTLPPGDVRQCLVALSESSKVRDLFNYRFEEGTFSGHAFGNVLLSALEKMTGSFTEAVETASEILRVNGVVLPATLDDVRLKMEWPGASVILRGERVIDADYFEHDPRKATLTLVPNATPNPTCLAAIEQADLVVIAPGDLYTSLGPLLIIDGIGHALKNTKATTVYVSNLVTKKGQTEGFTVSDHADEIERFAGAAFLDYVLYNEQVPENELAKRYEAEDAYLVPIDRDVLAKKSYKTVAGDFLGAMASEHKGDMLPVTRSLIRHDSSAVAKAIIGIYNNANGR
ncbi:MAG: YvcK family protein [Candidatus Saccharibacteria bacterium]|nr:MAG: YvcK family protein [Candidatus Saccharibacteria bacterium]